jgi:hypothetical protein
MNIYPLFLALLLTLFASNCEKSQDSRPLADFDLKLDSVLGQNMPLGDCKAEMEESMRAIENELQRIQKKTGPTPIQADPGIIQK